MSYGWDEDHYHKPGESEPNPDELPLDAPQWPDGEPGEEPEPEPSEPEE